MTHDVKTTKESQALETKRDDRFGISTADLRREFDRLFDTLLQPASWFPFKSEVGGLRSPWRWGDVSGSFFPKVDHVEKDNEHLITAEIPGADAKDLSVDVSGDVLTIKGEKTHCSEKKNENYHLQERHQGAFLRSFPLPRGVDSDKIKATFDKGVLTVTLPKISGKGQEAKNIEISSP